MEIINIFKRAYLSLSAFISRMTAPRVSSGGIYGFNRYNLSENKLNISALRNLSKEPIARSAINQIKDAILNLDWDIVSIDGTPHKKQTEILRNILKNPNNVDEWEDFLGAIIEDLVVCDMGCVETKFVKSQKKHPIYLFPIDAETIEFVQDWSGNPKDPRYAQCRDGIRHYYTNDKVFVMQRTKFTYDDFGHSPMETAYKHLKYLINVQEYADEISGNAMPKYLVNLGEMTSQSELDNIREYIENYIQGSSTLGILSTKSIESKQVAPIGDEATSLNWQKMLLQVIATCFNIPPERLGSAISNDRSTSSEKDNEMMEYTIKPWSKVIARAINKYVVKRLGYGNILKFTFIYTPSSSQKDSTVERVTKLLESDLITFNEARGELKGSLDVLLGDIPNGDTRLSEYKNALTIEVVKENAKQKATQTQGTGTKTNNANIKKGELQDE